MWKFFFGNDCELWWITSQKTTFHNVTIASLTFLPFYFLTDSVLILYSIRTFSVQNRGGRQRKFQPEMEPTQAKTKQKRFSLLPQPPPSHPPLPILVHQPQFKPRTWHWTRWRTPPSLQHWQSLSTNQAQGTVWEEKGRWESQRNSTLELVLLRWAEGVLLLSPDPHKRSHSTLALRWEATLSWAESLNIIVTADDGLNFGLRMLTFGS